MKISALLLTAFLPLAALGAAAQDVPTRAGRLAYIEGEAAVYQDPELGWDRAFVNVPITSENSVWTDRGSRAEVRVSGIAIRMDQLTQLDVARLDDDDINAFVPRGSVGVRIRHFANNTRFDLATPQGQFRLFGEGTYRLDVDPERDETLLTVLQGAAALRSASGDVNVDAGNAVRITGGPSPAFYYERIVLRDFDRWAQARDARWVERQSVTYVSPYMTGYEDLDTYGQWSRDPELGAVWFPTRVANDWAPYRYGHWAYVRPWGYTWVDDAPWGYAPFHYGRWVNVRNRWGWIPGERVARPVWAPALVAWVGGNVSVSIGAGAGPAVGWYPLSPWDSYTPWFRAPSSYVSQVNIIVGNYNRRGNDRDRREWTDRTRERGSTVVNREQFQAGRAVAPSRIQVTAEVARQLPQANPTQVLPSRTEVMQRRAQVRSSQPQVVAPPPAPATASGSAMQGRPSVGGAPAAAPQATAPSNRGAGNAPVFARPQSAPAPQAAQGRGVQPQVAQPPQAGVPAQAAPAATPQPPQANSRQNREAQQAQERARREAEEIAARQRLLEGQGQDAQKAQQREQQQEQQRQQREAQQVQERQQRGAQQAQERAQQETQRQQQEAQRQQREAQQVQERQQREAQQAQQRTQQEAQRQQQTQERQQREAAQAQERQQREAQQAQQRAQQQAQEKQQRDAAQAQQRQQQQALEKQQREAAQAQQKAQQEAAQAQQKAQQEAQRQQQQQKAAPAPQAPPPQARPQQAQPQQAQPQPAAPPPAQPQNQGQGKGRGQPPKDKDDDEKDKDKKK